MKPIVALIRQRIWQRSNCALMNFNTSEGVYVSMHEMEVQQPGDQETASSHLSFLENSSSFSFPQQSGIRSMKYLGRICDPLSTLAPRYSSI